MKTNTRNEWYWLGRDLVSTAILLAGMWAKGQYLRALFRPSFLVLALIAPSVCHAQLVADSQTNVLDGAVTNILAALTVGTNGSWTVLVVSNAAAVTATDGVIIGENASAQSNRVIVTGSGSLLNCTAGFYVGENGSANELDVLNGGAVNGGSGTVGYYSSNNIVLVSDPGSLLNCSLTVGGGPGNFLVITNGGTVNSSLNYIGYGSGGSNCVLITGAGSSWNSRDSVNLGYGGNGDQLNVVSGGSFVTSNTLDIGLGGNSCTFTAADPGSSAQCQNFWANYDVFNSHGCQCIVSNGATLAVTSGSVIGAFTEAIVTGAGSVWTNTGYFDFTGQTLSIAAGGWLEDNDADIGAQSNLVVVTGTNSLWNTLDEMNVEGDAEQLLITNGGVVADSIGQIENDDYVLVSGIGSLWTNLQLNLQGSNNTLVVADGGEVTAAFIALNNNSLMAVVDSGVLQTYLSTNLGGSDGLVVEDDSQLVVSNGAVVNVGSLSVSGNGAITIDGGTTTVSDASLGSPDSLVVNAGLFSSGHALDIGQTNTIVLNGGTIQAAGMGSDGPAVTNFEPLVVGNGINQATFQMWYNGFFYGGFVVSSNALLTGETRNGNTVYGSVIICDGGSFAPDGVTINGGLFLSKGCTTITEVWPAYGYSYPTKGLTNVNYGGTLQLTNLGGVFTAGQTFQLFSSSQYGGAFTDLVPASPGAGLRWDTNELIVDGVLRVESTTPPRPAFAGTAVTSDGRLVLSATGGIAFDPGYLYSTTNLSLPFGQWDCITTNYFDINGTTTVTNTIIPCEPQRYYLLRAN